MRRLNSATLSTLRFFEAAARLQSFTRAAAELCITQGAVSQNVKCLEDRLGCKLFFRLPGQIKLTDDGKKFAEVVTRVLRELEDAAEAVIAPRRSRIDVRLRAGPSFALRWLVPRLGRLHAQHSNIKLHVIGDYGYFDPVHRDFDLAVEFVQEQAPLQGLHTEFLMDEYLAPVCSPQFLAENDFLRTPADLAGCTLLHDGDAWEAASEDAEWRYWLNAVGARKVDSNEGQFFTLANMAIEAALSHQGVAMGRLSLVDDLLASKRLITPFPQRIKGPIGYRLAYPSELAGRPGVTEVANWLREETREGSEHHAERSQRGNLAVGGR
jgi:LysR family transcriptional regulator, glycine cleavage system transcriptional activator